MYTTLILQGSAEVKVTRAQEGEAIELCADSPIRCVVENDGSTLRVTTKPATSGSADGAVFLGDNCSYSLSGISVDIGSCQAGNVYVNIGGPSPTMMQGKTSRQDTPDEEEEEEEDEYRRKWQISGAASLACVMVVGSGELQLREEKLLNHESLEISVDGKGAVRMPNNPTLSFLSLRVSLDGAGHVNGRRAVCDKFIARVGGKGIVTGFIAALAASLTLRGEGKIFLFTRPGCEVVKAQQGQGKIVLDQLK